MKGIVTGGFHSYGQLGGILMSDSIIPRIPGDPGYAGTLSFPVRYEIVENFPFDDLVSGSNGNLNKVITAAQKLESAGVRFVAADCGLFSTFQNDIASALNVPFLGSPLSVIPLVSNLLPRDLKIGVITGSKALLKDRHFKDLGIRCSDLYISGMDNCAEFESVVINKSLNLDVALMRQGVIDAANSFLPFKKTLGAVILECGNLCSFRSDVQKNLGVPVFDMVSLLEFFAGGYALKPFKQTYI